MLTPAAGSVFSQHVCLGHSSVTRKSNSQLFGRALVFDALGSAENLPCDYLRQREFGENPGQFA